MNRGEIQQIGTPDDIYTNPRNTFVAGFIGSPPMNLIDGSVLGQRFVAEGIVVDGVTLPDTPTIKLGVRPEDTLPVEAGEGHVDGQLYGIEPTGDQTFLSVKAGDTMVEVKGERDYRLPLDSPLGVRFDTQRLYFFDAGTGLRVEPEAH